MAKVTSLLTQQYMQSLQQQRQQQQQQLQQRNASAVNKPVTVRSVTRRDKAKVEERQNQQHQVNITNKKYKMTVFIRTQ